MLHTASELEMLVQQHLEDLRAIPEDEMRYKPTPAKWSRKEILGHMADSAMTNIRRLVTARYEHIPHIVYDQDKWVALSGYQDYDTTHLIDLWYRLNMHLAMILRNMPPGTEQHECRTENLHTLEWLAQDYTRHLKHHLHQVLNLEPVAYP